MTTEGTAGLSVGLLVDQTAPVSPGPGVQGQGSPAGRQGKPRRPTPPLGAEEGSPAPSEKEDEASEAEEEGDSPSHRIDSLA